MAGTSPSTGRVCACGGPKSKQGRICQACRTAEKRSPIGEQHLDRRWGGARVVGDGRYSAARIRDEIAAVAATLEGEFAELAADQAMDQRLGRLSRDRWMVSLDDVDRYGRPLHEVIAA